MKRLLGRDLAIASLTPLALLMGSASAHAQAVGLGTAAPFAILAGQSVTSTGITIINGNVGVSPGTSITGFTFSGPPGPGIVNGTVHLNDAVAIQAQVDLVTAFNEIGSRPSTVNLSGQDLGGMTLIAGVYDFDTSAQLTGTLTLDAQGNPNAVFIIDIGSTLTTASNSSVQLVNGAQGGNVFFRVGSSATLGTNTAFAGDIIALTSITLNTGATINCGAALARNGSVTLDSNVISVCTLIAATIGSVLDDDVTPDVEAVADVIDDVSGPLPIEFEVLIDFLSPEDLAEALSLLTGEVATGVTPSGLRFMDSFLSRVLDSATGPGVVRVPLSEPGTPDNTVMTLGYSAETVPDGAAFDALGADPASQWSRGSFWAGGYGGIETVSGDAGLGTSDRMSRDFGFAMGVDFNVSPRSVVGFAVGGGVVAFHLAEDLGGGVDRVLQVAAHTRVDFDAAYIVAGVGYGWHNVTTDRFLTLVGTDHLRAEFDAHSVIGEVEAGYRIGHEGFSLTPFAAAQVQGYFAPAYSEVAVSGSPVFALDYDAHATLAVHTEVGARVEHATALNNGGVLVLNGSVAWGYDFMSDGTLTAHFQALPGSSFEVGGATAPTHSLLVSAGAEVQVNDRFSVATLFNGAFAPGLRSYGVSGELRYNW